VVPTLIPVQKRLLFYILVCMENNVYICQLFQTPKVKFSNKYITQVT